MLITIHIAVVVFSSISLVFGHLNRNLGSWHLMWYWSRSAWTRWYYFRVRLLSAECFLSDFVIFWTATEFGRLWTILLQIGMKIDIVKSHNWRLVWVTLTLIQGLVDASPSTLPPPTRLPKKQFCRSFSVYLNIVLYAAESYWGISVHFILSNQLWKEITLLSWFCKLWRWLALGWIQPNFFGNFLLNLVQWSTALKQWVLYSIKVTAVQENKFVYVHFLAIVCVDWDENIECRLNLLIC